MSVFCKKQQVTLPRGNKRGYVNAFKGKNAKQRNNLMGVFGMLKWDKPKINPYGGY